MGTTTGSDLSWINELNLTGAAQPDAVDKWEVGKDNLTLINNKSLIPQSGELTKDQITDVDETTLLCEMAARGDTDPIDKPLEWYKSYINKLVTLGWQTDSMDGQGYHENKDEFKLSEIAVLILSGLLSGAAGSAVRAAITQLQQYDKEKIGGVDLFTSANRSIDKHSFAVSYAHKHPQSGTPEMGVAFFSVKLKRSRTNILLAELDRQTTDLFAHSTTLRLTTSYDDDARKTVRSAIKEHRTEGIKKWKLKK